MARYNSHPPIFGALTRKVDPYGAVAQLARKLAVKEPNNPAKLDRLNDEIDFLLGRGEYRHRTTVWLDELFYEAVTDEIITPPEDLYGSPEGANE